MENFWSSVFEAFWNWYWIDKNLLVKVKCYFTWWTLYCNDETIK